jgi:hypothetical protein
MKEFDPSANNLGDTGGGTPTEEDRQRTKSASAEAQWSVACCADRDYGFSYRGIRNRRR